MRKTVVAMAVAAAGIAGVPAAQATESGPVWSPCAAAPQQECATIEVPLDYARPGGRHISLAISRIRTAVPQLRRGVLVLIPGGPGNSGLTRPATLGMKLPKEVLDRYDLVGFDPRGVGQSTPVTCALAPEDADPKTFLPWPGLNGDITQNVAKAKRVADACGRNGGEVMRHINTPNEARDIDRIRRALGERKLSYWGVSYGTYAGAVYATMFPERTDRVVLDSNDDPDPRRVARAWAANFAVGAEDRFPDFAAWAAERHSTYGLGATPEAVRTTYLTVTDTLDRNPRPDLTGNYVRTAVFNSIYNTTTFPFIAETLRAAATGTQAPTFPLPSPEQFQNTVAVSAGTVCNDVAWPRSVDSYAQAVLRNRQEFPLTAGMPANIFSCAFWPYQPVRAVQVTPRGPDNVLLVQNLRDPATPYSGALKMLEAFGHRARMVTVNSGGHGSYLVNGNTCGDNAVTAFLVSGVHRTVTC